MLQVSDPGPVVPPLAVEAQALAAGRAQSGGGPSVGGAAGSSRASGLPTGSSGGPGQPRVSDRDRVQQAVAKQLSHGANVTFGQTGVRVNGQAAIRQVASDRHLHQQVRARA